MKSGMRCRVGMKIHGLVLGLLGCTHIEALPIVAPAGLDVTMDPSEGGVIIEDEVRRHAVPPGMMRRRVYAVEDRFVRWYPPTRRQTGHWWLPPTLPGYPADRVALRGGPAPAPGQRFVVFNAEGPRGVVEATGERCPPGHEDCVACEVDDPERLHWARYIGAVPDRGDGSFHALGPFDIGESLPAARALWQMDDRRVGRWNLDPITDLDGDGAADIVMARTRGRDGAWLAETWRLYDGRWYTEPRELAKGVPMHVLELELSGLGLYDLGEGWIGLPSSGIDGLWPTPGEYRIIGRHGEQGRVSIPERSGRHCFWNHGPPCHPAQWTSPRPRKLRGPIVVVGPVETQVGVRSAKVARPWWETRRWEPNLAKTEVDVELTDGRRWTVTRRPCALVGRDQTYQGWCHEGREDGGEGTPQRWMSAEFRIWMNYDASPVCRRLDDSSPHSTE